MTAPFHHRRRPAFNARTPDNPSRRAFLSYGGAVVGGALVGACGGGSDDAAAPLVEFTANAATIAGRRVELPWLGRPHTWVAAPTAGFVIASAVDSQRLWIVEAA